MHYIDDSTGICTGLSSFEYKTPYHIHNLPLFISYATGIDIDEDELWQIARRNRNLVRVVNIRRGLRREDERPLVFQASIPVERETGFEPATPCLEGRN